MRVVAIIQARMGSTRLPGKVLFDLAGEPMLARCVNRTQRSTLVNEVVVATTKLPQDDQIVSLCRNRNWHCFRGSESDVLDRYYRAAVHHRADIVVRITSDCPLIDPEMIDLVLRDFLRVRADADYATNILPGGEFARGLDVEVIPFKVLEEIWRNDLDLATREHVTLYLFQKPFRFRIHYVEVDFPQARLTVDTIDDFNLVKRIFNYFGHDRFALKDLFCVLEKNQHWLKLNRHVTQKALPDHGTL